MDFCNVIQLTVSTCYIGTSMCSGPHDWTLLIMFVQRETSVLGINLLVCVFQSDGLSSLCSNSLLYIYQDVFVKKT